MPSDEHNRPSSPSANDGSGGSGSDSEKSQEEMMRSFSGIQALMQQPAAPHSQRVGRRASMPGLNGSVHTIVEDNEGENDAQSVRSMRSSRSSRRRASMTAPVPSNSILADGPRDGYGADDDEDEASVFSARSRTRSVRRTSVGYGAAAPADGDLHNYGGDSGSGEDSQSVRSSKRRASSRRVSLSGGLEVMVVMNNDHGVRRTVSSSSSRRRASLSGGGGNVMMAQPNHHYRYDQEGIPSNSMRGSTRRASLSGTGLLGEMDISRSSIRSGDDSIPGDRRALRRRASLAGGGGGGGGYGGELDISRSSTIRTGDDPMRGAYRQPRNSGRRRASLSGGEGVDEMDISRSSSRSRRSSRRASMSGPTPVIAILGAHDLEDDEESSQVLMPWSQNLAVSGRGPPSHIVTVGSGGRMVPEIRLVQRNDTVSSMESEQFGGGRRSGGKRPSSGPERRQVLRMDTADSIEVNNMRSAVRRGGKRNTHSQYNHHVESQDSIDLSSLNVRRQARRPVPTSELIRGEDTVDNEEGTDVERETLDPRDFLPSEQHSAGRLPEERAPYVVARPRSTDLDDLDYGYAEPNAAQAYGYSSGNIYASGNIPMPRVQRRGSAHSHASARSRSSRASARSQRRNSIVRPNLYSAGALGVDESSESGEETFADPRLASYGFAEQSEDESESSELGASIKSDKRLMRRNSCLTYSTHQDSLAVSYPTPLLTPRASSDREPSETDLLPSGQSGHEPTSMLDHVKQAEPEESSSDEDELIVIGRKASENVAPEGHGRIGAKSKPSNEKIARLTGETKEGWVRRTPFTTSYTAPTLDNLKGDVKVGQVESAINPVPGEKGLAIISTHVLANDDKQHESSISSQSLSDSESETSYGASLYAESRIYQEIDKYKQKPRRRQSIENTWIDMSTYGDSGKDKGLKKPEFKPAEGYTNASDFIVRCFTARLRQGFTVVKHNRSRWSKSASRIIFLDSDGVSLTWKPAEGESDSGKRPRLDLSKCKEIRHAWSADPNTRRRLGTGVLRKKCKDGMANKSFSLIFAKRTLDMTALSTDQCKVMMEGFSALCFRLQLDKLEEDRTETKDAATADDDWASTVYGESVSAPLSSTRSSAHASSWGV